MAQALSFPGQKFPKRLRRALKLKVLTFPQAESLFNLLYLLAEPDCPVLLSRKLFRKLRKVQLLEMQPANKLPL